MLDGIVAVVLTVIRPAYMGASVSRAHTAPPDQSNLQLVIQAIIASLLEGKTFVTY